MPPSVLNRAERRPRASDERRVRPRFHLQPVRPRFISIKEAADYLGVSRSFFYAKLISNVRTIHLAGRHLVDLSSLDELGE
jgi:excisionase family DNA binding protein